MKNILSTTLFVAAALVFCGTAPDVLSQDGQPPRGQPFDGRPEPQRPKLLRELGLTQEQVRQIRMMNAERKPLMETAQQRLREANRELDLAIYSDVVDDGVVSEKLRQFQAAQAEVSKLRFGSELEMRKILTPEQLVRFRNLRRRFAQARELLQERRQERGRRLQQQRPLRRQQPPPNEF